MESTKDLRILILEGTPPDAELMLRSLSESGLEFKAKMVDAPESFATALSEFDPDILLTNFKLQGFDGTTAVKTARAQSADLPIILVSELQDDAALEVIKAGADDYVLKDRLIRLPFVVRRSLLQAAERRARRRAERAMRTLSAGNQALVHATDEGLLLREMCGVIVKQGGYRMAWIGTAENDAGKTVRLAASADHDDDYIANARISWADVPQGRGPTGTAIRTGAVVVSQDIATNPIMAPWREAALPRGFAASIALPIKDQSGVLGALTIYASEPDAFDLEEQALLTELVADLSFGLTALRDRRERDVARKHLQRTMEDMIEALATTVEARDPYTAGHQRRVAKLAAAIAREMHLPEQQVHGIYLAGLVHDVGKIHFPAEILMKPGPLSALERAMIETHAQLGYDILKNIDFPWPIAQAVLQHHERIDGSGYPNRLQGDAICLEARIIAVADHVEAMTSERAHRKPFARQAAMDEIEKGKGKLYDVGAADACLEIYHTGRLVLD